MQVGECLSGRVGHSFNGSLSRLDWGVCPTVRACGGSVRRAAMVCLAVAVLLANEIGLLAQQVPPAETISTPAPEGFDLPDQSQPRDTDVIGTWVPTPEGLKFKPYVDPETLKAEDEKSKSWTNRFSPSNMFQSAKAGAKRVAGTYPNRAKAQEYYEQGEKLFREKDYAQAERLFKKAGVLWPDSSLQEDAWFMTAECQFFTDRYPKAHTTYGQLLKKYENSRYLDTVVSRQFAIGRYWEQLQRARPKWVVSPNLLDRTRPLFDTAGNALEAYESVRLNDPTGPLADDSIMATANAHFVADRYEDADYYYTLLRTDYPRSDLQLQAHLLGLRSKLMAYQGPQYDGTPLDEAKDLARQTMIQFPTELGEERDRLIQAQRAIEAQLAQRIYERAELYYRTKYYRAARHHYNQVMADYPGSRFAELAQERLVEIKDKPDLPKQRLTWLANLFPGEKKKQVR